jgi:hypothetical protein
VIIDPRVALRGPASGRRTWMSRWMGVVRAIGNVQAWIILTIFYVIILAPIGWLFRLRRADPLRLRRPGGWQSLPSSYSSLQEAQRQS